MKLRKEENISSSFTAMDLNSSMKIYILLDLEFLF